jgi:hypothetical protein
MLELIVGVGIAIPIALFLRFFAQFKLRVLAIRKTHLDEFYRLADEVVSWDDATKPLLRRVSNLSATLASSRMQLIAIQAARELNTGIKEDLPANPITIGLSPEHKATYHLLFFHWLIAVCSQGSMVGMSGLFEIVKWLNPNDLGDKAESILLPELDRNPVFAR